MTTHSIFRDYAQRIVPAVRQAVKTQCHFKSNFRKVEVTLDQPDKARPPRLYCLVTFKKPYTFKKQTVRQLMGINDRGPETFDMPSKDPNTIQALVRFFDVNIALALGVPIPAPKDKDRKKAEEKEAAAKKKGKARIHDMPVPKGKKRTAAGILVPVETTLGGNGDTTETPAKKKLRQSRTRKAKTTKLKNRRGKANSS